MNVIDNEKVIVGGMCLENITPNDVCGNFQVQIDILAIEESLINNTNESAGWRF